MDKLTFAGLLAATPPAGLSIIELTAELTRPDGSLRPGRRGRPAEGRGDGLHPGPGLRLIHGTPSGGA